MSVLRETTRVTCHRVLTRVGTIQETRNATWEALPSQLPPLQPSLLLIEVAEEGGEERDDDVEAEVWPLVGTGVPHILLRRDVAVSGGIIDEVSSADAGSVGNPPLCHVHPRKTSLVMRLPMCVSSRVHG